MHDPYAFPPMLTDYDLHLLGEGTHWRSYERLGAHLRTVDGVSGVNFAVWAPNAESVAVVGDFNVLGPPQPRDAQAHPQRRVGDCSFPDIKAGAHYKYAVKHRGGHVVEKCDPYGFAAEVPPRTANIVTDLDTYQWNDAEWISPPAAAQCARCADVDLRSSPGQLAARSEQPGTLAELPRAGPATGRVLPADGLHARAADAGQRAPVHRQLGLPDDRLLRRHQPLRHAARLHVLRRHAATRTASA